MREDWLEVEIGLIAKIYNGNSINERVKEEKYKNLISGLNYIGTKDVSFEGEINYQNGVKIPLDEPNFKIAPKGCVLVCSEGGSAGRKTAYITEDICFGNKLFAITNEFNVFEGKYIFYYTRFRKFFEDFKGQMNGIIGGVSAKKFAEISCPLAPLPEQRAIVAKIEELFSDLDKGIDDLKKAKDQLVIYRQAVLKKAFEGELTKEWREKQSNLLSADELLEQIKVERENHYKLQIEDWKRAVKTWEINSIKNERKPLKPKKFKELDDFLSDELDELALLPKGWIWMKNENYLFEVKDGTHDTPKYVEKGIPFITQKNIKNNNVTFDDVKYISIEDHNKFYKRSNVSFGDIIIAMIGHGRGNSCIVNTDKVFSIKNVGLFKFFNSLQSNIYALNYYQSTLGLNLALKKSKGGAQPFIGLTELRNWPIPVCSIKEQHQIVKEIESRLSICEKVEQSINESLEKSKALRQSILKKAFEGTLLSAAEIAKCKQEQDYEPAAVLLAKIKAEKKKSS